MKVAAALRLKNDYSSQLPSLRTRILYNIITEEGQSSGQDPIPLIASYESLSMKLIKLTTEISIHNTMAIIKYPSYYDNTELSHLVGDIFSEEFPNKTKYRECSVVEALNEREILKKEIDFFKSILSGSHITRRTETEIKKVPVLDLKAVQKKIDSMSKFLRILDGKIQEHNWLLKFEPIGKE